MGNLNQMQIGHCETEREREETASMGRPPCCDKPGIKKGPWTPEEDLILVSYIQEHGPGNWRSVPTNTGLLRCSKSCRLRWTNYLRPGIKRGSFTAHEEGIIIHLQSLLGNKWAAIASYLPQRTDNDIKNYWNTHLKKKLGKLQEGAASTCKVGLLAGNSAGCQLEPPAMEAETGNLHDSTGYRNSASNYASSADNISRLLEGWRTRSSEKLNGSKEGNRLPQAAGIDVNVETCSLFSPDKPLARPSEAEENPSLTFLEKWLFDDTTGQLEGLVELATSDLI
ncbi:hypothetical protein HPP92_013879 [Vanilla planifolia]|uniref:Uncharacterized protein n=1 Tax=Vanilla planifolia TaxID=51239 RepID=A0A835QZY4_VANPL|nr:hypothetical protein HPP92_013879 [Vanilla planifolia]